MIRALVNYDRQSFAADLRARGHNDAHAPLILRRFFGDPLNFSAAGNSCSKALRAELNYATLRCSRVIDRRVSVDGTVKLLVEFDDGHAAEAVMMPTDRLDRTAGCVSSQVGRKKRVTTDLAIMHC